MSNAEATRWIARYRKLVRGAARHWLGAARFARTTDEDLESVGNLAVLEAVLMHEEGALRLDAWVRKIVMQRMGEWIALASPDVIDPAGIPAERTADLVVVAEAAALRRIEGLPKNDRAIVALRLQGVPLARIAEETGVSRRTLSGRLDAILDAIADDD